MLPLDIDLSLTEHDDDLIQDLTEVQLLIAPKVGKMNSIVNDQQRELTNEEIDKVISFLQSMKS